jgi:hypothetical protein
MWQRAKRGTQVPVNRREHPGLPFAPVLIEQGDVAALLWFACGEPASIVRAYLDYRHGMDRMG